MSTFRNPVGPQPARVYWRRRLVLGLGLLAVILIVVLIVVRPGSGAPTPTPSASKTSTGSPTGASTGSPTGASTNGATGECDPKKVTVTPSTDAVNYAAGVNPVLTFSLKSSATTPCTFSAGSDVQEFRVTSGDELYWTSKDCQSAPVAAIITLQPGVPFAGSSLTWDRTRSSVDTCELDREQVPAAGASYHLEVTVGGIESATTKQFLLD